MNKRTIREIFEIAVPLFLIAFGIYIGLPVFFGSDIGFFGCLWRIPVSLFLGAGGLGSSQSGYTKTNADQVIIKALNMVIKT